tara:strand:+ start:1318 stop:1671 length:354 start_codon:yes stop_codon:yes gene_type:complete
MEYIDLDVWREARKLVKDLYLITNPFPQIEVYGLTTQMRRSVVSIPSNIAEGCGRRTSAETIHFLHISRGSLYELETQTYLASDQEYIKEEESASILKQIETNKKLLNGFINYYKNK